MSVAWRKSLQKMRGEDACGARLAKLPCSFQRVLPSASAKWPSLADLLTLRAFNRFRPVSRAHVAMRCACAQRLLERMLHGRTVPGRPCPVF